MKKRKNDTLTTHFVMVTRRGFVALIVASAATVLAKSAKCEMNTKVESPIAAAEVVLKDMVRNGASSMVVNERNSIASILKGMIKVPGRDLWLSETELTQGQWEAVMGNNPSLHKGVNLPVENISRDECDMFLEKLNQTKEVQASQFKFCLPGRVEWAGAARAGNPDLIPWIKPGVHGVFR